MKNKSHHDCIGPAMFQLLIALSLFLVFSAFLDSASGLNRKGNRLYEDKRYQSALEMYQKAQVKKPRQPEILYNLGTTLYQTDQFSDSAHALQSALDQHPKDKALLAQSWYNYGNAQYRLGQFENAIEAYKEALELNPKDPDAKHNLELLLKKKALFENKQDQRNQNRQDKKKENKNKNQKQSQGGSGQTGEGENEAPKPSEDKNEQKPANQQPKPDEKENQNQQDQQDEQRQQDQQKRQEADQNKTQQQPKPQPADQTEEKDKAPQSEAPERYFQGQMSKEDANRILDALRESEKELQLLKQPKSEGRASKMGRDW